MSHTLTDPDVSPDDLRRLTALLEQHNLTELRYEHGDVRVTLRTAAYFRQQTATVSVASVSQGVAGDSFPEDTSEREDEMVSEILSPGVRVEAPIMGVFYRAATPADPPFVEVGDRVEVGQAVGLIEAMKVFSEVKSEVAGVIREIPVTNKALVQPGDALMILDEE